MSLLEQESLLVAQRQPLKGAWLLGDIPARTSASGCMRDEKQGGFSGLA